MCIEYVWDTDRVSRLLKPAQICVAAQFFKLTRHKLPPVQSWKFLRGKKVWLKEASSHILFNQNHQTKCLGLVNGKADTIKLILIPRLMKLRFCICWETAKDRPCRAEFVMKYSLARCTLENQSWAEWFRLQFGGSFFAHTDLIKKKDSCWQVADRLQPTSRDRHYTTNSQSVNIPILNIKTTTPKLTLNSFYQTTSNSSSRWFNSARPPVGCSSRSATAAKSQSTSTR